MNTTTLKQTTLHANHVQRGAKMTPFGGFDLPVWFSSLKQEHEMVRTKAGLFDISHMGLLKLTGPDAQNFLQTLTCNDVAKTLSNTMVYSMMLNEKGMILDDIMMGYLNEAFYVVVNASNKPKILNWMNFKKAAFKVTIEDLNTSYSFIALQGPQAVKVAEKTFAYENQQKRFSIAALTLHSVEIISLRTGYTGEDGFEWMIPHLEVDAFWNALIEGGASPCGLGARDTLRLEAGLPLYGQELSENIHPFMTRYSWVVKSTEAFIGKEALETLKHKPSLTTVGLKMNERIIARSHYPIQEGGEVTSGTLSPSLDEPIAMALVKPEFSALGTVVHIQIRNQWAKATVVALPFVKGKL